MFTLSDPWSLYAALSAVCLLIYYSVVGFIFYRHDLTRWVRISPESAPERAVQKNEQHPAHLQSSPDPSIQLLQAPEQDSEQPGEQEDEHLMQLTEKINEKLKVAIKAASERGYEREDLITILQMITVDYHQLQATPLQLSVNAAIDALCEEYGLSRLDSNERADIWQINDGQHQQKLPSDDESYS
jgi:hypothetical protein